MNDDFNIINSSKYLFLTDIYEPFENCLQLEVTIPYVSDEVKTIINNIDFGQLGEIKYNEISPRYKIIFDNYISYSVINESYDIGESDKFLFEGRLFKVFQESDFLEYLSCVTYATPLNNYHLKHYQLVTLNHIVNIASINQPLIEKIN
ncbi:hypothetical protein [Moheibacter lacus]|uniref:Uncharacterized protein n=1 Tax=Moheibacter lacus TaxID=2745851 RepID=A0A838ZTB1_9FLAO|nr:hypothetical protein [Moheibacter lacus]MBA5630216.1 hypothetical protein [Moheibacter lacus]